MVIWVVAKDCSMSITQTAGSKSSSLGTPIQAISMVPVSPREHGVRRLLIIMLGLVWEEPQNFLNCVVDCTFLMDCMKESHMMMLISVPE